MSNSIYTFLRRENLEIRVLTLLPGDKIAGIECEMAVRSMNDAIDYEALSYVWGSTTDLKEILVNGTIFRVTRNLHDALLRLRSPTIQRHLWVDAISINQSDIVEKSWQVALMGHIYSTTKQAILWLGEEPAESVPAVSDQQTNEIAKLLAEADELLKSTADMLALLNSEATQGIRELLPQGSTQWEDDFRIARTVEVDWTDHDFYETGYIQMMQDVSLQGDSIFHAFCLLRTLAGPSCLTAVSVPYFVMEAEGAYTYRTNALRALHWLLTRSWWERIWTVQECICPQVAVIHYGPVKAPFHMFLKAGTNLIRHRTSCCAGISGINDILNYMIDAVSELDRVSQNHYSRRGTSLEELLRIFRSRNATNQKDKIYALLPLEGAMRGPHSLNIDYSLHVTPNQVFVDATLHMIGSSQSLSPLCQPSHVQRNYALPSWVPDYANRVTSAGTALHYSQQLGLYSTHANTAASVECIQSRVLVLEGRFLGKAQKVSTGMMYHFEEPQRDVLREWHRDALEHVGDIGSTQIESGFWRTICGDTIFIPQGGVYGLEFRRLSEKDKSTFNNYCHQNGLGELALSSMEVEENLGDTHTAGSISQAIRATSSGRKFFITDSGAIGVGPFYMGLTYPKLDEIYVIPGGRTPFVLKAVGERDIPGVGVQVVHELLGECYLHGYMDGEGMVDFEAHKTKLYLA